MEAAVELAPGDTLYLAQLAQGFAIAGRTDRTRELLGELQADVAAAVCVALPSRHTSIPASASTIGRWTASSRPTENGPAASTASRGRSCSLRDESILGFRPCSKE